MSGGGRGGQTNGGVAAGLLIVGVLVALAAYLIGDASGADLALAPVFVGAALAVVAVRLVRHRSGSRRP